MLSFLLLSLMLGGIAPAYAEALPDWLKRLPESKIPWEVRQELSVNPGNQVRRVVRKGRLAGLYELTRLAKKDSTEEAWVFLADAPDSDSGIWVEIGKDETDRQVRSDAGYLVSLMLQFENMEYIHLHPTSMRQIRKRALEKEIEVGAPTLDRSDFKAMINVIRIQDSLPSGSDLYSTLVLSQIHRKHRPKGSWKEYVCSSLGVIGYSAKSDWADRVDIGSDQEKIKKALSAIGKIALEAAMASPTTLAHIEEVPRVYCDELLVNPKIKGYFDADFIASERLKRRLDAHTKALSGEDRASTAAPVETP